jgi:ParB family chromosome partitioning protein
VTAEDRPGRPRRGLGRGLEALLGSPASPAGTQAAAEGVLLEIDPEAVSPNPEQPRRTFDEAELAELAESIRTHGLLQPIVVERQDTGFRLVAGHRRLRAARLAGMATIPAVVRPATDSDRNALELALIENLQRTDLSPLEEAAAYARLADTFGLSHEAIGLRVGRSRATVSNTVRLLALSPAVQAALAERRLSAGHARALLALTESQLQERLAADVEVRGLSVRQTEEAVAAMLGRTAGSMVGVGAPASAPAPAPATTTERDAPDDRALERGLEQTLGTPVHLQRHRRGGRLLIDFFSDEQLDGLYTRLGGPPL